jgi:hypothetical protein
MGANRVCGNGAIVKTIAYGWIQGLSFAPNRPDRIVYGLGESSTQGAMGPPNLYSTAATSGPVKQLTHDGRSLNPLWGARGVVFDRETSRKYNGLPGFPEYQLFLIASSHVTQITHMNVSWLGYGLAPVAVSSDGTRLRPPEVAVGARVKP